MKPSSKLRRQILQRDNHRCWDCGTTTELTLQPRITQGSGRKVPALTASDIITMCVTCARASTTTSRQRALALGYQIGTTRGIWTTDRIPAYDRNNRFWWLLDDLGGRTACLPALAGELLAAAGNLTLELAEERRT